MNRDNKLKFWVTLSNEFPDGDKVIGVEHSLDNCSADTIYMTECDDVGDAADQVVEYRDKAKEQWPEEEIYLSVFGELAEFPGNDGEDIAELSYEDLCDRAFHEIMNGIKRFPMCPCCGERAYKLTWYANEWSGEKYCSEGCANRVMEDEQKQNAEFAYGCICNDLETSIPPVLDALRAKIAMSEERGDSCNAEYEALDWLIEVMDNLPKEVEDESV